MKDVKRENRRYQTKKVADKRLFWLKRIYGDRELPASKIGRCRKQHPYDCGNSHCVCCNYEKIFNVPSVKMKKENYSLREMMKETYE